MDAKTLALAVSMGPITAQLWAPHITAAMDRYGINTPRRQAAFLAQVAHESAGFERLVENLNYSAAGLARTWPNRYATAGGAPNALARSLAYKPEALANNVYADRMGNGDEASGDGWRYRGQGPIQLTGRDNVTRCAEETGLPLIEHPELLQEPEAGAMSAAWFWRTRNLNQLADAGNIDAITRKINGGMTGAEDRRARYAMALAVLS